LPYGELTMWNLHRYLEVKIKIYIKMKITYIIVALLTIVGQKRLIAQVKIVSLKEGIQLALANKPSIMAQKANAAQNILAIDQLKAQNKTQVALAYDYLYNPIVRSSIVPVGQFGPNPTDEVRALKFGTNFNQNIGVQVIKPLYDASINSKIAENKLQQRIDNAEIATANEELAYEVAQSFVKIMAGQKQITQTTVDTLRTFEMLKYAKIRLQQGKGLKTDVNKAQINHNTATFALQNLQLSQITEKIYFGFLINMPAESFEVKDIDKVLSQQNSLWLSDKSSFENISKNKEFDAQIDLLNEQQKNERIKYLPTVQAKGYVGADQFTDKLNPFAANSWFGNSFLGISVRLPILQAEDKKSKLTTYKTKVNALNYQKQEQLNTTQVQRQKAIQNLEQLKAEAIYHKNNVSLYKQNLDIYKERLEAGQETLNTINLEEIAYQNENERLILVESKTWQYWLTYLKNAGILSKLYQ
jgi:outer membrane protein